MLSDIDLSKLSEEELLRLNDKIWWNVSPALLQPIIETSGTEEGLNIIQMKGV